MNLSNLTDASKRRSVIYAVLKQYFTREQCIKALWVLENNFAVSETFSVLAYIDEITDVIEVGNHRSNLSMMLTKELYSSAEPAYGDPLKLMQASVRQASTPSVQSKSPKAKPDISSTVPDTRFDVTDEMVVFSFMLNELILGVQKIEYGYERKMCDHLSGKIKPMGLTSENATTLQAWTNIAGTKNIGTIKSKVSMIKIVHEIYLWACDYLGPIPADKLFAKVVKRTEELPQAARYSPRNFFE